MRLCTSRETYRYFCIKQNRDAFGAYKAAFFNLMIVRAAQQSRFKDVFFLLSLYVMNSLGIAFKVFANYSKNGNG